MGDGETRLVALVLTPYLKWANLPRGSLKALDSHAFRKLKPILASLNDTGPVRVNVFHFFDVLEKPPADDPALLEDDLGPAIGAIVSRTLRRAEGLDSLILMKCD